MSEISAAEKGVNDEMRPLWLSLNLAQRCMVLDFVKKLAGNIVPEKPAAEKPKSAAAEKPKPAAKRSVQFNQSGDDVEEALEQCGRILGLCDEVPDEGSNFVASVSAKVESIQAWIEDHDSVTQSQQDALDNMEAGVSRWVR